MGRCRGAQAVPARSRAHRAAAPAAQQPLVHTCNTEVSGVSLPPVWRHVHREGTTGRIGWRAVRGRGAQARTMVAGHLPSVRSRWLTRWRLRSAQGHPVGRPHPPRPRRRPHHPARCTNRPPGPGTTPVLDREATAISTERKKRGRHSLLSIGEPSIAPSGFRAFEPVSGERPTAAAPAADTAPAGWSGRVSQSASSRESARAFQLLHVRSPTAICSLSSLLLSFSCSSRVPLLAAKAQFRPRWMVVSRRGVLVAYIAAQCDPLASVRQTHSPHPPMCFE